MQLQLQDFTTLVRNMAASVQGSARTLVDLTTGSVLRAILEANASIALWLQWLTVQVLAQTRAATSSGADLDSWVADFSLARLPGQAAVTTAVFSRITKGQVASIPAGAQVKTADGSQTFAVLPDPSNPAYDPAAAAYTLAAAAASITVPIQAAVPGVAGNVQPGFIALLATAMPGIDAVTNPLQAQGGLDAEPDAALRARFANFIDSRSRATPTAIAFAIDSLQQGLSHVLTENLDPAGAPAPGTFVVTVDDGSGAPPSTLLSAVASAVDAVRPVGTQFFVQPPSVLRANVSLSISVSDGGKPSAQAAVTSAITAYVAGLPIGASLPASRVAALAYGAARNVTNVSALTINGGGDLVPHRLAWSGSARSWSTDMTGDLSDIIARLKAVLPTRWFPDQTPVLDTVLTGLATAWSGLHALLAEVQSQSRMASATGQFLDGASADFFAARLPRRSGEPDSAFRGRIHLQLARDHATRAALASVIKDLTGHAPTIFEPSRVGDTGGYGTPGFAYGHAGAWGSLALPFQVFVTVKRAQGEGIANIAGYGTADPLARASLSAATGQVTDADVYAAVASVMPTTARAWTRITN